MVASRHGGAAASPVGCVSVASMDQCRLGPAVPRRQCRRQTGVTTPITSTRAAWNGGLGGRRRAIWRGFWEPSTVNEDRRSRARTMRVEGAANGVGDGGTCVSRRRSLCRSHHGRVNREAMPPGRSRRAPRSQELRLSESLQVVRQEALHTAQVVRPEAAHPPTRSPGQLRDSSADLTALTHGAPCVQGHTIVEAVTTGAVQGAPRVKHVGVVGQDGAVMSAVAQQSFGMTRPAASLRPCGSGKRKATFPAARRHAVFLAPRWVK